jgi:hypothetical protein
VKDLVDEPSVSGTADRSWKEQGHVHERSILLGELQRTLAPFWGAMVVELRKMLLLSVNYLLSIDHEFTTSD